MTTEHPSPNDRSPSPERTMPCVLVVDDSRVMRVALSRLLSKSYQVIEAEDGEQGWQRLQDHPEIELVFSDLSMPVMDGFELLQRVRAADDPAISGIPLVVITGHEDDEGMQRKAAQLGASDFVSKPFRSAEITTRAKTLIGLRRDTRKLHDELSQRATHDAATGLADAAHFAVHFDAILSLARRHGLNSACLVVQLDDFESLIANLTDTQTGGLLHQTAERLRDVTRSEDALGHLGDGCFALALIGTDRAGARLLAQRLAQQLDGLSLPDVATPAISLGISTPVTEHTVSADGLLKAARANLQPMGDLMVTASVQADKSAAGSSLEAIRSWQKTAAATTGQRHDLQQAREALLAAEQDRTRLNEQLAALKEGARAQVAKVHQEMKTLRSRLNAVQAQFSEYMQEHPREAQAQSETEIAQLRAVLNEHEEQLETERVLRRQAQEMVEQLQARLAVAAEQYADATRPRGGLLSRLFKRG